MPSELATGVALIAIKSSFSGFLVRLTNGRGQ